MRREYTIGARGDGAVDVVREQLAALPVDMDDVTGISITIEADGPDMPGVQQTLDEVTMPATKEVEYGPVPESEREERPGTGGRGGGMYRGRQHEGAVMPDTKHASVLRAVDGAWRTSREVADELGMAPNKASAYLSQSFKDRGLVKRRGEPPYEYALDMDGMSALELGERMYRKDLEES